MGRPDRFDVGVLLIHGIGQQRRGDTLVGMGEPIHEWFAKWVTRNSPGQASVTWARVTSDPEDPEAPAAAVMELPRFKPFEPPIDSPPGPDADMTRWLLAESNWSDSFTGATYGALAGWGLQVLPFTLVSHYKIRLRRARRKIAARAGAWPRLAARMRAVYEALVLSASLLVLAPLLTIALIGLLVFGLVPIPAVRRTVAGVQRALSATLGDSYIYLTSPIQRAAIFQQVRRDLSWLSVKCKRVAVVAHSQGAAIAHDVLRSGAAPNVTLFCSVGSGLNKMLLLKRALARYRGETRAAAPVGPWLVPIGMSITWYALVRGLLVGWTDEALVWGILAGAGFLVAWLGVGSVSDSLIPRGEAIRLPGRMRWVDYFASSDPVPNGPLMDEELEGLRDLDRSAVAPFESRQVRNGASVFRDHTSYWSNADEFVADLAQELASVEPEGSLPVGQMWPLDSARLDAAGLRRVVRIRVLRTIRLLAVAFVVAMAAARTEEVRRTAEPVRETTEDLIGLLPQVDLTLRSTPWTDLVAGSVSIAAIIGMLYLAVVGVWKWWNHSEIQRLHLRADIGYLSFPLAIFLVTVLLASEVGAFVLVGWTRHLSGALALFIALLIPGVVVAGYIETGRTQLLGTFQGMRAARARPGLSTESIALLTGVLYLAMMPPMVWTLAAGRSIFDDDALVFRTFALVLAGLVLFRIGFPERTLDRLARATRAGSPAEIADGQEGEGSAYEAIQHVRSQIAQLLPVSTAGSKNLETLTSLELAYERRRLGRMSARIARRLRAHSPEAAEWLLRGTAHLGVEPAIALAEATGDAQPLQAHVDENGYAIPAAERIAYRDKRVARRWLKRHRAWLSSRAGAAAPSWQQLP